MRKGDTKLFNDKNLLCRMLNLRSNGWSYTSLAIIYKCDRSSISSQCEKYGITPLTDVFTVERIISEILPPKDDKWVILDGEKINRGKSYEEYRRTAISS